VGEGRQQLVVAVAFVVLGALLIEFWLGRHLDAGTLAWVQGAWVAGILAGLWLRRRFGRPER
jgi:O-antigen/teichoic acid export membrane protein